MTKSRGIYERHGCNGTRIYRIWYGMKTRCYFSKNRNYRYYGAKGITVCDEWRTSFIAFHKWAMEAGYRDDLSIDRIDPTAGYEPSNCRWATRFQQTCHRRLPRRISRYRGVNKQGSKWQAQITYAKDGVTKKYQVGWCDTALQAALAYDEVAHREHGEYAVLNFPERFRRGNKQ